MGFDVQNFGIGLAAGWASAYGIYRTRRYISAGFETVRRQSRSIRHYLTRSADGRYLGDLSEYCQRAHVAGRFVKLAQVLVEPRFLLAAELPGVGEEVTRSVFEVVPRVYDHPFLHAPYPIESLSLAELVTGERSLALLGVAGSGRSTALHALILWMLGEIEFKPLPDKVQERLTAEEAALDDAKRAERIKARVSIEERAKERLAKERGLNIAEAEATLGETRVEAFKRLMPVYVHLANVNLNKEEFGNQADPAEPLVRAVQYQMGRVTGSSVPVFLYNRLNKGQAALLIDGYDELPANERPAALAWLQALKAAYAQNFFIVVGTPQGSGALLQLGLTPVYVRPWSDLDIEHAAQAWARAWPQIGGTRRSPAPTPEENRVRRAISGSRAWLPYELTLKIWGLYADDSETPGLEGWLRALIARQLPKDQSLGVLLPRLAAAAALQLDEGVITRERIEARYSALFAASEESTNPPEKKDKKEETETGAQKFLTVLRRAGLVIRYRGERFAFHHAFLAAYLASLTLPELAEEALIDKALNVRWTQAFAYAALHMDVEAAVKACLTTPADMLHTRMLEAARWLAYAPAEAAWREAVLKQLGGLLVAANQYPLLRERAAAALIATREMSAARLFKAAAKDANADVRRLACLCLGALRAADGLPELTACLQDAAGDVQIAAGLALGALGTQEALEAMIMALTSGSEQLRKAIAEAFTAIPDEGYPVLYDAIEDEDMNVRRAAIFGLRRINANWSLMAVYKTFLDDSQWYVRSAAQEAFIKMSYREASGPGLHPAIQTLPWLEGWAGQRGQELATPAHGEEALLRALREGEPPIKILAALTVGQLGMVRQAGLLYTALRDRHEAVRAAAQRALGELQMYIGEALPLPS
ncbi:MAG: HEAT repeat domain-containing protein [Chloroflexi bacterium]|nr:HEAT repeat domain-containing protein [Chloroflexota bacterium]